MGQLNNLFSNPGVFVGKRELELELEHLLANYVPQEGYFNPSPRIGALNNLDASLERKQSRRKFERRNDGN